MALHSDSVVSARPIRIVVAANDPEIRQALDEGLHAVFRAADISFAENGHDALENIDLRNIDLPITDHKMPLVMGSQLAAAMAYLSPNAQIIVFSGDTDLESQGMFPAHTWFISKSGPGGLYALLHLATELQTQMPAA